MNNKTLIRIIGWAGTTLIITAYTLNSFNYISTQNIIYSLLNLFGAILIGIRVYVNKNWSNVFLEIFWGAVAILSILNFFHIININ